MARGDVLITPDELDGVLADVDLLDVRWRLGEPSGAGRDRYREAHLPGARFLDLETVLTRHGEPTDGRLPEQDRLRELLGDQTAPLAAYCGWGVSAAQLVLAGAALDLEIALYPGSWSAWSNDPSRPVATGESEPA